MTSKFDWSRAWIEEQEKRRSADDSSFWDMRAPSFSKTAGTTPYADEFIKRAGVRSHESVFDMGCGSGTLALPLARAGHQVYAADFSQVMLDLMMRRAEIEGTQDLIHPILLAWDDDWSDADIPVCDLAFASRSIATRDLRASLVKLESKASRRVCITLSTGLSPRIDSVLLEAIGRSDTRYPDCVFGFNILWELGIWPDVSYITSKRASEYESFDDAIDKPCEIMEASAEERARLIEYAKLHLREIRGADGRAHWEYDHQRITSWAFLSWDKCRL